MKQENPIRWTTTIAFKLNKPLFSTRVTLSRKRGESVPGGGDSYMEQTGMLVGKF